MNQKYILLTLVILFTSFPQITLASKKKELKEINKIIKCSRKFIDRKKGGADSVEVALVYLKRLREIKDDLSLLTELKDACYSELRGTRRNRKAKWSEFKVEFDRLIDYPLEARQVVSNFIDPKALCEFKGIGFSLGFVLTLGFGAKVAICTATNGEKFFAFAPKAEFGGGGGVNLYYTKKRWSISLHTDEGDIIPSENQTMTSQGIGVITNNSESEESTGLGAGYMVSSNFELALKTIPLGNDFTSLKEILFKDLEAK